jgi:HAD superfamily hydrolase (TIGR01509 family)
VKPQALLLDLGNVTVRLRQDWLPRLAAAAAPGTRPEGVPAALAEAHHAYERGRIDGRAFHAAAVKRLGVGLGYEAWLELWNGYFEPNRPMEALLARLRGQARVWGLSNTNAEHLAFLRLNFRVLDSFEGLTASNEAGAAKPEAAIFEAALAGLGLAPAQVLYLDDVPAYVQAGRDLGLRAFHYTYNDAELKRLLLELGFTLPPLGGASVMAC